MRLPGIVVSLSAGWTDHKVDYRGNGERIAGAIANVHYNRRAVSANGVFLINPTPGPCRNPWEKYADESNWPRL